MLLIASIFLCSCGQALPSTIVSPHAVTYNVVLANDPRLPAVPRETIDRALCVASDWIDTWYQKRVRFEIVREEPVDSYMLAQFEKLPFPADWSNAAYNFAADDHASRFLSDQIKLLKNESIAVLRAYVPEDVKPLLKSPGETAKNLLRQYEKKIAVWREIRLPTGEFLIDGDFPEKFSFWHWNRAAETVWPDQITDHVVVTNELLLEDELSSAPPHALVRGGLLNGMEQAESPQSVVSTFLIYTDIPEIARLRDGPLSENEKLQALAAVVAHEVGTHFLQGYKDVYDHDACLAYPVSGLEYKERLRRLFSGPPCRRDHPMLDRKKYLVDRYQNMSVCFLAAEKWPEARKALKLGLGIDPSRKDMQYNLRELDRMHPEQGQRRIK